MLDTSRFIETPEGVQLELSPAGPVVRALAWAVDLTIRGVVGVALGIAASSLGEFGIGLWLLIFFALEWVYPVAFEMLGAGATPGKRMLGLKTLRDDGLPIDWSASVIRNLLRTADFLPLAYLFGLASMLLSTDFKRLGDLAAGTIVVHAHPAAKALVPRQVAPVQPPWAVNAGEQRALISFAERAPRLSAERAEELAGILHPITGLDGPQAIGHVLGYAAWLHGRR